jgi:DNA-binding HxlR family transcriptional regulator
MRSYNQYCATAKALDAVGDRWTLLIIRELVGQGPCRYTDLMNGLPGIATNMLADRLTMLEESGLIWRELAPPPVAATLYHLTEAGADLKPVLDALGTWGVRFMSERDEADRFRSHWFRFPASLFLHDNDPEGPAVSVQLSVEDQPAVIEAAGGEIRTRPGTVESPDLELAGPPQLIMGLLSGGMSVKDARTAGMTITGSVAVLDRLRRLPTTAAPST